MSTEGGQLVEKQELPLRLLEISVVEKSYRKVQMEHVIALHFDRLLIRGARIREVVKPTQDDRQIPQILSRDRARCFFMSCPCTDLS